MLILAIDTSTRTGSLALLRDGSVLAEVSAHEETPYSTRLFKDLESLKAIAPFELSQIDVYAVAAGPGSFTGLRIGLTAVKAWAEVYGKPIAAVSGLRAISAQSKVLTADSGPETRILAPFFDARRGQLFGSLYRRAPGTSQILELVTGESILSPNEFIEMVKASVSMGRPILVSPTPDLVSLTLIQEIIPDVELETVSPALAATIGKLGFEQALSGELLDPLRLDANYVRRSDAEAAWKDG